MGQKSGAVGLRLGASPRLEMPDGRCIELAPRDAAMLTWLALEGPTARARLTQLLWPDSEPAAARNALRQRLFQLKRNLGFELVTGQATLALAEGLVHDLDEADDVLGGVETGLGGAFDEWLAVQRGRRRSRLRQALEELVEMAERAADWPDAMAHARELLALEPLSEEGHRRLMRLHYLAGDRAAALLAFDACERVLKDEVGVRPGPATLALLADIERCDPGLPPSTILPAALLRPPQAIGRQEQVAAMQGAWDSGTGFVVVGEPGVGKSRLLRAMAQARDHAVNVAARPGDLHAPLSGIVRLVDAIAVVLPVSSVQAAAAQLHERLVPAQAELNDRQRPLARSVQPAVQELLQLATQAAPGLAVLFDDWQFADEASVGLLEDVMQALGGAALPWGIGMRVPVGPRDAHRLDRLQQRGLRRITLEPLGAREVEDLVESLHLPGVDASSLAPALARRIGGNPLYILEALRHMYEQRLPLGPEHVKPSPQVRDLVAVRLAELPEGARQLLRIAAVAGSEFSVELAEAVSGRHALELSDAWAVLQRLGILGDAGVDHDLYAEVALASLPPPIARVLHARAAQWLEDKAVEPARLAAHWRAAGDEARALPHLVQAARQAWRASLAEDTFTMFHDAAVIAAGCGRADQAFELLFDAIDAMTEIGTVELARRGLLALEPLASSDAQRLRVRFVGAVVDWIGGQVERGLVAMGGMLDEAVACGDVRVECECRYAIAHRASADGRFDDALRELEIARRQLQRIGECRRATALAASMALVEGLRGRPEAALQAYEQVLPEAQAHGDVGTWAVVSASQALQITRLGMLADAARSAERVAGVVERTSIAAADLLLIQRYLVEALRWGGRIDAARRLAESLAARLGALGDHPLAAMPLAAVHLHVGRADLARPLLKAIGETPPTRQRERWAVQMLSAQYACLSGSTDGGVWPAELLEREDLPLAAEWAMWSGLLRESPWSADALDDLAMRCERARLALFTAPLRALVAWRSGGEVGFDPSACADAPATLPFAALYAARAMRARGEHERSRGVAAAARGWIERVAASDLSASSRPAWLSRHPVHRELQALACASAVA